MIRDVLLMLVGGAVGSTITMGFIILVMAGSDRFGKG